MNLRLVVPACAVLCTRMPAYAEPADGPVLTDPDRNKAAQFFRAGQEGFLRGDYTVAAHSFEQAHRLLPSGPTIYNAARSWDRVPEAPQALAAYEEALTQADLSEAQRGHAQKRVEELRKQGVVPPTKPVAAPAAAQVTPPGAKSAAPVVKDVAIAPTQPAPLPEAPSRGPNYAGWTGVSIAGAAGVATAICGWVFLSKRNDFIEAGQSSSSLRREALLWGKLTSVGLAATAVGAGVAIWGFHARKNEQQRTRVSLLWSGTVLSLGGAF